MSHELSFTAGRADFFELGKQLTAWHGEGIALPVGTPFQQALEVGHLLYTVEKQPVYRENPARFAEHPEMGLYDECATGAVTVRMDRGVELGVVGKDYTVIQNAEAFALVQPLVESGALRLETGGVLRDGADAWVLAQINPGVFPDDVLAGLLEHEIAKYILVRTNHTGRANCSVTETDVRVVCANTLGMVESGDFRSQASIQHRGDAKGRLDTAFSLILGGIVQRTTDFLTRYETLRHLTLTEAAWQRQVMDVVQRDPRERADFDPKSPMADATVQRYTEKRETIHTLWREGKGHQGDDSAWEAYNGVVEAVDHDADVFPVRSSRVKQLVPGGRLYDIKDRVFASLVPTEQDPF